MERWNAGCHVGTDLLREIRARGYTGGRSIALDFIAAIFPALRDAPVLSALSGLDQKWTIVVVFSLLILILIFRPSGLLGEQVAEKT